MSDFNLALPYTLKHEGGFVDHPTDPGGATNMGVSLRELLRLGDDAVAEFDVDGDGDLDIDDIRAMNPAAAELHYRANYWHRLYSDIENQDIATKLFDSGVNMGTRQAVKLLQRAINWYTFCAVDGIFGPQTLNACNTHSDQALLLNMFVCNQAEFYFKLLEAKPERRVFIHGWLRRAYARPQGET